MKIETNIRKIYEPQDYEKAKNMPLKQVIEMLEWVDEGWIGDSNYRGFYDYEGDERDYDLFRIHAALRIAIRTLSDVSGISKESESEWK